MSSAIVALIVTSAVILFSSVVSFRFRFCWRLPRAKSAPEEWLMHGVFVSFCAISANAAFWSTRWFATLYQSDDVLAAIGIYGGYFDILVKGPIVWAAIAHLKALQVWKNAMNPNGDDR